MQRGDVLIVPVIDGRPAALDELVNRSHVASLSGSVDGELHKYRAR